LTFSDPFFSILTFLIFFYDSVEELLDHGLSVPLTKILHYRRLYCNQQGINLVCMLYYLLWR